MRYVMILLVLLSPASCVSSAVTTAVRAYATAVNQVAESGQADVTQCQNQQDPQQKQQFCDKASKQFKTISDSAAELQTIK